MDRRRDQASGKFISASNPGVYQFQETACCGANGACIQKRGKLNIVSTTIRAGCRSDSYRLEVETREPVPLASAARHGYGPPSYEHFQRVGGLALWLFALPQISWRLH